MVIDGWWQDRVRHDAFAFVERVVQRILIERERQRLAHPHVEQRPRADHLRTELNVRRPVEIRGVEDVAAASRTPFLLRRKGLLEEDCIVDRDLDVAREHICQRSIRVRREDDVDAIDPGLAANVVREGDTLDRGAGLPPLEPIGP